MTEHEKEKIAVILQIAYNAPHCTFRLHSDRPNKVSAGFYNDEGLMFALEWATLGDFFEDVYKKLEDEIRAKRLAFDDLQKAIIEHRGG